MLPNKSVISKGENKSPRDIAGSTNFLKQNLIYKNICDKANFTIFRKKRLFLKFFFWIFVTETKRSLRCLEKLIRDN